MTKYVCKNCGAHLDPGEKCDCKGIDVEFCRVTYRQAKNPQKQIGVLAQLFLVSKADIIKALGDLYGNLNRRKNSKIVKKQRSCAERTARLKALLTADILCGATIQEAADRRGVTYNVAAYHTFELRQGLKKAEKAQTKKKDYLDELMGS